MKGYPKRINTKQDFLNLLENETFRDQAIADLEKIYNADDDTVIRVVSGSEETDDLVTEEISNPMPLWKQKGFKGREEVKELIERYKH